jgi:hypothetical protein
MCGQNILTHTPLIQWWDHAINYYYNIHQKKKRWERRIIYTMDSTVWWIYETMKCPFNFFSVNVCVCTKSRQMWIPPYDEYTKQRNMPIQSVRKCLCVCVYEFKKKSETLPIYFSRESKYQIKGSKSRSVCKKITTYLFFNIPLVCVACTFFSFFPFYG